MARLRTIEEYLVEREQQQPLKERIRMAGIPSEYHDKTWRNYRDNAQVDDESFKDILMHYADTYEPSDRQSIVVLGDPGIGKTMGMALLAKDLVAKDVWTRWITYAELVRKKQDLISLANTAKETDDWDAHDKAELKLKWITNGCQALFLDDLGKEHRTASGWAASILDDLLRTRQAAGKLTFISSNTDLEELADYNPSMPSFFRQMAEVCAITDGKDMRQAIVPDKRKDRRARR